MGGPGSGRKPRDYPSDVVDLACSMYEAGMTVAEIRRVFPAGYRVQTILERYLPERRAAAKRHQAGEANHMWRGEDASYAALHLRVTAARGRPSQCDWCGTTEGRFEWANVSGDYHDINDFDRLCVACHRRYDANRRALTGRHTIPEELKR